MASRNMSLIAPELMLAATTPPWLTALRTQVCGGKLCLLRAHWGWGRGWWPHRRCVSAVTVVKVTADP